MSSEEYDSACFFCAHQDDTNVFIQARYFFVRYDDFPVNPGHCELVPKRHVPHFFDLTEEEVNGLVRLVAEAKAEVTGKFMPDGWNYGWNEEAEGGQTQMHFHFHIIPRYKGDVENPRGGIRNILPGGDYKDQLIAIGRGKYLNDE